jgi:hypothetical protein
MFFIAQNVILEYVKNARFQKKEVYLGNFIHAGMSIL